MQQATATLLLNTIKTTTELAHRVSGFSTPLTLLWQLSEAQKVPDQKNIYVYSYVEPSEESESGTRGEDDSRLYRNRGAVVQEIRFPKLDSFFHDSLKFTSLLQDAWRKKRDVSISYYDPLVAPMPAQPDQTFLQWQLRVVYDAFETI